ncbi:hypothetical protein O3G_MSEX011809 [Manduca sexta]|nr:hypothetical protein O3G_MSEX011809 [Manduca sexta]KAG6460160.1 hypothetical protein O3G_MSEX011809 [Manduca sexta]
MRSNLSPLFTSSKIRMMVPFIVEVSDRMVQALKTRIQQSESGYIDLEAKEVTGRYAVDVLASCAFGLRVESHSEDNEFYAHTRAMTNFNFLRFLKTCAFRSFPTITKWLNISLAPPGTAKFFEDVVMNTIIHREEHNIVRPDMIHLLMLAKKGLIPFEIKDKAGDEGFASVEEAGQRKYHVDWTYKDLVSQAVLFVFAGFDTVSSSMAFMFHQLAINPVVQERLYQEISENEEKCGGKFEYTNISKLTYLDMFVSECLRCWPPGGFMDRLCVKDYNLGKPRPDAKHDCIVRKGECIGLPYWAFHYNPKFFPDPEKFDPERFSEENKDKIKPYTYLPFGAGFRNCIGSRLALHEVKIFLYQMVLTFKFSAFEKTPPRAQLVSQGYDMEVKDGAWVRLHIRSA